jgi:hypothetical protein
MKPFSTSSRNGEDISTFYAPVTLQARHRYLAQKRLRSDVHVREGKRGDFEAGTSRSYKSIEYCHLEHHSDKDGEDRPSSTASQRCKVGLLLLSAPDLARAPFGRLGRRFWGNEEHGSQ